MSRKWKKQEKETLRQQLSGGTRLEDVKIPGRNWQGISRQARKLDLVPRLSGAIWTPQQKQKLTELRGQGIAPKKIAELNLLGCTPRRTVVAICKACIRMGLVGEKRSRAARNRKIWSEEEKQEFIAFLLQRSAELAPAQIAKIFGVSRFTVEKCQRRLGVKLCFTETMSLPYVKKMREKSRRERSQRMLANFENGLAKKEEELEALAQKIRGSKHVPPLEEKQCATCGRLWPKHKRFFYYSSSRANGFTCWYFFTHCKICTSKQRHAKNVLRHKKKYCA